MNRARTGIALLLFLITLAVYWQAGTCEFINYDDPHYVTHNPQVKAGLGWHSIPWAFTTTHAANWHPITWLSHMADVELYGLQPCGHHLTSVLLHAANALLLFLLFARTTNALWPSASVALLFALHPLRVESVAWISERKDVLSLMFGLLALHAYIRYVTRPAVSRYLPVFGLTALSLLAKPMMVTLPFVMLLLDYWPLNRVPLPAPADGGERHRVRWGLGWLPLVAEKVPLAALAMASAFSTMYAQHHGGAMASVQSFPLLYRLGNAVMAYGRYLGTMFYPVNLAVFYPLPQTISGWKVAAVLVLLLIVTCVVLRLARQQPYLVTGWLWFLVTLMPVIGIVQVGMQAMADRYTYLPSIGIAIIVVWGSCAVTQRLPLRRPILALAAAIAAAALTVVTWQQLTHWRTSETLLRHAITVTDNNFIALGYLGLTLHDQNRYEEAIKFYRLSLSVNPAQDEMHYNLGLALRDIGQHAAAVRHFEQSLEINPALTEPRFELALICAMNNRLPEAAAYLEQVVTADPAHVQGHYNLGLVYRRQAMFEPACRHFSEAARLAPSFRETREELARCAAR